MVDSWVLTMMLIVSLIIGFIILAMFIWGTKTGQFDDEAKVMNGLLFDSQEDLQEAIKREQKKKELMQKKKEKEKNV